MTKATVSVNAVRGGYYLSFKFAKCFTIKVGTNIKGSHVQKKKICEFLKSVQTMKIAKCLSPRRSFLFYFTIYCLIQICYAGVKIMPIGAIADYYRSSLLTFIKL